MSLSSIDHFLIARGQAENQQFQRDLAIEVSGLREKLADKTAGLEAANALLKAIIDAYKSGNQNELEAILGNYERRQEIYTPVYDAVRSQLG